MKHIFSYLCLAGLASLTGCQFIAVDSTGAIPAGARSFFEAKLGTYHGVLEITSTRSGEDEVLSQNFAATLTLDGLRPGVQFSEDLLGPGCLSKPGRLLSLQTHPIGWDAQAVFEFDRGNCAERANAQRLVVYSKNNNLVIYLSKDHVSGGGQPHLGYRTEYRAALKR